MRIFLVVVHTLGCLFLITAVLLQSGRGGGVGAAFAGASGQIFGGRGASSFLVRITSVAAALFFITSLSLSMISSRHRSVLHGAIPAAESEAAAPGAAANTDDAAAASTGDAAAAGSPSSADSSEAAAEATGAPPASDSAPAGGTAAPASSPAP